jgi:beta-N-acetylhexosaminidase
MRSAYITGLAGESLTAAERTLLAATRPAGIILFARNCISPDQVSRLVAQANDAIGTSDTLVLIDQEGGRVQRLRPPHWRELPPAQAYASLYTRDPVAALAAARQVARLTAADLRVLGINTNCTPVLDLPVAGAHDIIGNRAFGNSWPQIAALGRAVAGGHMDGGVVPVIKHIPGHGRATADSHLELPTVATSRAELEVTCFAPFHALRDMPAAMTAHVVFSAIDAAAPASTSAAVIEDVIRGKLGFDGLLMSDDLGMKALAGPFDARARAVIAAGSDLALHCSGEIAEMEVVAASVPAIAGGALRRFQRCLDITRAISPFDERAAIATLVRVLNTAGA